MFTVFDSTENSQFSALRAFHKFRYISPQSVGENIIIWG